MDLFQYKLSSNAHVRRLLTPLFVLFFILLSPAATATELDPAKNIKPAQSQPVLENLPERTELAVEEKDIQKANQQNAKSKPSWWKWLTNASKKPASFHYIDIIELLN